MIRANLLPRARESLAIGSWSIDAEHLRQGVAGLVCATVLGGLTFGLERWRIAELHGEIAASAVRLDANAPARARARAIMADIAAYQNFARELATYRRTGRTAATVVARIGNSLPAAVWLDSFEANEHGFALQGASTSLDAVGKTVVALGNALPHYRADILSVDHQTTDTVRFAAQLTNADAGPAR